MRRTRLAKRRPTIDKSALAFGEPRRVRDRKYLNSARTNRCAACGSETGVIAAHIRTGNRGGVGLKPSDCCVEFLCDRHHREQEANPGPEWWYEEVRREPTTLSPQDWLDQVYIPKRQRAYQLWRMSHE